MEIIPYRPDWSSLAGLRNANVNLIEINQSFSNNKTIEVDIVLQIYCNKENNYGKSYETDLRSLLNISVNNNLECDLIKDIDDATHNLLDKSFNGISTPKIAVFEIIKDNKQNAHVSKFTDKIHTICIKNVFQNLLTTILHEHGQDKLYFDLTNVSLEDYFECQQEFERWFMNESISLPYIGGGSLG